MPVPHPGVAQTLDQRNVRFEVLNLVLDLLRNILERRDVLEVLDTLVDGLEGSIHIGPAVMEQRRRGGGMGLVLAISGWFDH